MIGKIILIGGLAFVAGSAMTAIDNKAGPGTTKASVSAGFGNLADLSGETFAAGPKIVQAVTPALRDSMAIAGNTLGGVGQAAEGAAAPGASEGAGDPGAQP